MGKVALPRSSESAEKSERVLEGEAPDVPALRRAAYAAARSFGLSAADADDVAQHTLLQWMTSRHQVEFPFAWLRVVVRRKCMELFEARARTQPADTSQLVDIHVLWTCKPELPQWALVELRIDLAFAMSRVSNEVRTTYLDLAVAQLSFEELGARTGLSRSTLYRQARRGRRVLRALLRDHS